MYFIHQDKFCLFMLNYMGNNIETLKSKIESRKDSSIYVNYSIEHWCDDDKNNIECLNFQN
jgi:hypothetical protein